MSAKSWWSVVFTGVAAVLGSVIAGNTPANAGSDNNPRTYAGDYQGGSLPIGTFLAFQYASYSHANAFVDPAGHALPDSHANIWVEFTRVTYFAEIANQTLASLPPAIRSAVGETRVIVEDFADDELLASLDIEDPFELTGVYEGVDLTQRSILDLAAMPSTIRLFRRPILDEWFDSDTGIASLIEHVFVHEVAHHFGYSDADIERVEG